MKKTNYIILLGILFSSSVWGLTAQQAFEQGKTLATQEKDITKQKGYINDAPNKVPGYVSTRQEESMFGGAELTSGAIAKQQGCAANPQQDGKVENHQECEAVNFLAGRPSTKSKSAFPDLSSDPSVVANINVSQNLESVLNQFGYSITTSQTNCTNKTITNPAQYIENSCIEGNPLEAQSCTYGRTVVIDADSNYKCNETVNAYEVFDCEKTYGCPSGGSINGTQCVISDSTQLVQKALSLPDVTTTFCTNEATGFRIQPDWQDPRKLHVIMWDGDGRCGYNSFSDAELMAYGFPTYTEKVYLGDPTYDWMTGNYYCSSGYFYSDNYSYGCYTDVQKISRKGQYHRAATFTFDSPISDLANYSYSFTSSGSGCHTVSGTTSGSRVTNSTGVLRDYNGISASSSLTSCPAASAQVATITMTGGSLTGRTDGCLPGYTQSGSSCQYTYTAAHTNGCSALEARAQ